MNYNEKAQDYFSNIRKDLISLISPNAKGMKVLEVGAAYGETLFYLKQKGIASEAVAVDLFEDKNNKQNYKQLDNFIFGNIEEIELNQYNNYFDLILLPQLQRQIRFVQESDTCVQLLEEELTKANEKIAMQEGQIDNDHQLEEENLRIKETLHSFTHESKSLLENIEELEKENDQLKNSPQKQNKESNQQPDDHFHTELVELRKEYAELEAKYLELKFK